MILGILRDRIHEERSQPQGAVVFNLLLPPPCCGKPHRQLSERTGFGPGPGALRRADTVLQGESEP